MACFSVRDDKPSTRWLTRLSRCSGEFWILETRIPSLLTSYLLRFWFNGFKGTMLISCMQASQSHPWTFAPWIVKLGDLIFCHFILGHNKQILRLNSLGNTLRFCCCHECFMNAPSSWKIFRIFLRSACFPLGWKDSNDSRPKLSSKERSIATQAESVKCYKNFIISSLSNPPTHTQSS